MEIGKNFTTTLKKDADGFYQVILGRITPYAKYNPLSQSMIDKFNLSPKFGEGKPPKLSHGLNLLDQIARRSIVPANAICFEIAQVCSKQGIDGAQYITGKVRSAGPSYTCLEGYLEQQQPRLLRFKLRGSFLPLQQKGHGYRYDIKLITWDLADD